MSILAKGVFLAVFPIVNTIAAGVLICHTLIEIAPRIMLFGRK